MRVVYHIITVDVNRNIARTVISDAQGMPRIDRSIGKYNPTKLQF